MTYYIYFLTALLSSLTTFTLAYLWNTKKTDKSLKELNYWIKMCHDKENEVNNLKLRINELLYRNNMI